MGALLISTILFLLGVVCYALRLDYVMRHTPLEAQRRLGKPITADDIRSTYERVKRDGIDWNVNLPRRRERRYIIVGGSGLVGSQIVLYLLARGTPPEAIRIIDNRPPTRPELLASPASDVAFIATDITSSSAVLEAFTAPWSNSAASLSLSVFHTAALIYPAERSPLVYHRCSKVNVTGTAHVLAAARAADATILVFTSSSIVAAKPVGWFFPPWRSQPRNYVQILTEDDFFQPLKVPRELASCYARSKAEAERLVCAANEEDGMRTGAIRPGHGVYGSRGDHIFGRMMALGRVPTWVAPWVQNWANAGNVALAHLQYEDVLLGPHGTHVAGRPFLVTDHGPPLRFKDLYLVISTLSTTGFIVTYPSPLLLLLVAYSIEAYDLLLVRFLWLQRWLPMLKDPINLLQPATFDSAVTCIVDDSAARKLPVEGGIGYRSSCTTLEGLCAQVAAWNEWVDKMGMVK